MDRSISPGFLVPSATFQSFINISIVIFIPIYDRVFVPAARSFTQIPSGITMLQRIGTGIFLSIISMVVAALVETKRLQTARDDPSIQGRPLAKAHEARALGARKYTIIRGAKFSENLSQCSGVVLVYRFQRQRVLNLQFSTILLPFIFSPFDNIFFLFLIIIAFKDLILFHGGF